MSDGGHRRPDAIDAGPRSTRFAEVRRFTELDSTNRYLLDEARAGAPEGIVVVAEHQTAGRGRLGRRWEAPPGANLLVSVLLHPALPTASLHLCSVAMALSAAAACQRAAGLEPALKWPNDLLVGERKLAGILAESIPLDGSKGSVDERRAVVVGLGLNVEWPPGDDGSGEPVPAELLGTATSLRRETGATVSSTLLLDLLLADLDHRIGELGDPTGRVLLAQEYRSRCSTLGRRVVVVLPDGETRGTAADITPEGHLLVDVGACFTSVTAGDVIHVRAPG